MKPIVDVALVPQPTACVTPLELLEDFADSTPDWAFLDDTSVHYAALKGTPACILRTCHGGRLVDLAFCAPGSDAPLRLCLVESAHDHAELAPDVRTAAATTFADAFTRYLGARSHLIELHTRTSDEEVVAA